MAETDLDRPDLDPSQDPLWQRLDAFELDEIDAEFKFSERLSRENGWSIMFAHRVIEEYKKFCYLAVRSGHSVTPSDQIDQVWHLHLTYSRNYWEEFCPKVLQTDLHHDPTRGGSAEAEKFHDWYEETLESYERMSGDRPPRDIWPPSSERFRDVEAMRRVDIARSVILPRGYIWMLQIGAALAFLISFFRQDYFSVVCFAALGFGLSAFRREKGKYEGTEGKAEWRKGRVAGCGAGGCGGGGCGGCGGG